MRSLCNFRLLRLLCVRFRLSAFLLESCDHFSCVFLCSVLSLSLAITDGVVDVLIGLVVLAASSRQTHITHVCVLISHCCALLCRRARHQLVGRSARTCVARSALLRVCVRWFDGWLLCGVICCLSWPCPFCVETFPRCRFVAWVLMAFVLQCSSCGVFATRHHPHGRYVCASFLFLFVFSSFLVFVLRGRWLMADGS